ncbi:MAG: nucleotide exchange factor GrpE [Verrucomicrobiae bacterium]|nr:nucleotide exchange factor GrpE [Verrucomicrobiae bacterium]
MAAIAPPRLPRWPFVVGDLVLVTAAATVVLLGHRPLTPSHALVIAGLCAAGAWVMILPFLKEHAAAVRLQEQLGLADTARQIGELRSVADAVRDTTAQWQAIHDGTLQASRAAATTVEQVTKEARDLTEALGRANDQEKQALRLEAEKLRRGGTEHLQVLVHVLDHVHALFQAAARHGNTPLVTQLGQFRAACLDAVRRIGLVSYEAQSGEPFDPTAHQTPESREPGPGARIASTIACGYTYQGQALRRILVTVAEEETSPRENRVPDPEWVTPIREVAEDPTLDLPLEDGDPS